MMIFRLNSLNLVRGVVTSKNLRVTDLAWDFIKKVIELGDLVVDATAGNGNDTLKLAECVGEKGRVLAFDIQEEAIETTRRLLLEHKMKNRVRLITDNHLHFTHYLDSGDKKIKAMMVNLGYLPGGSHQVVTEAETTIKLLSKGLERLEKGGMITVCLYSGHEEGARETEAILKWSKELEKPFLAHYFKTLNRNQPPTLLILQKFETV